MNFQIYAIMKRKVIKMNLLTCCTLCPRSCKIDRKGGQVGFCKAGDKIKVARASLHEWEEPCLSGTKGSGTVFFSHCTLKCIFCQNYSISTQQFGKEISCEKLSKIFFRLQNQGAHNINLVTPTHFVPQIISAIKEAKKQGLTIPIVYNSSGYETVDTIRKLNGFIDIYLPDMKYYSDNLAIRYSKAPHYFDYAKEALEEMFKQVGPPLFDENGILQKGVIVRHLLLPGQKEDTKQILSYLYQTYHDDIIISIMNQYTPLEQVKDIPSLNQKVSQQDYDEVINYAIDLGIKRAYIQEGETQKTSFIPSFQLEGID